MQNPPKKNKAIQIQITNYSARAVQKEHLITLANNFFLIQMFKKILLVHKDPKYDSHPQALKQIEEYLKQNKVPCAKKPISLLVEEDLAKSDLVIILGGDGTILKTVRYVKKQPVICINSDPKNSEGALTEFNYNETHKLGGILKGKFIEKTKQRLEVKINSLPLTEPVLNEAFFGSEQAFLISEYEITYQGKKEHQKSSGILIATGTGSTAWFASAGGKEFNPQEKKAFFLVREPYKRMKEKLSIFGGEILDTDFSLECKKEGMLLSTDSCNIQYLNKNDTLSFSLSKYPLLILCPKK
jgi:NAD+ kinase